jgi:hypothetical protein
MFRRLALSLIFTTALTIPLFSQSSDAHDKKIDIQSPVGDMHIGDDADAKKIGVPLYPGARPKAGDDDNKNQANLSILTEAFGMKLLVASYVSSDSPSKILDFYRDKLKRYGKVLECHSDKHGGDVDVHDDDKDSDGSKELKCEQKSGPVTELKVGTEDNQRVVAVESSDSNKETSFALVYVHTRGKKGEI